MNPSKAGMSVQASLIMIIAQVVIYKRLEAMAIHLNIPVDLLLQYNVLGDMLNYPETIE